VANIKLAYLNRADEAALSGGSWLSTLPIDNMKSRVLTRVARSTNVTLSSTKFDIALSQPRAVGVIALVGHTLSVTAKVRITADTEATFTAPPYQTAWTDVWPGGVIPLSQLEWEDDNFWLGTLTPEQRAAFVTPFIHVLTTEQIFQYWRIEIDDALNVAGSVDVGRLFLSPAWAAAVNYDYGAGLEVGDKSVIDSSVSGVEYFEQRERKREMQFTLSNLTEEEFTGQALAMQRYAGKTGEILIIPDSDVPADFPVKAFLCRAMEYEKITHRFLNSYSMRIGVKEL
jgi:hypothetical protein